jgi:hypothetical protein
MHCCLFATLKEIFVDNDLWLPNTCHGAVLIGHEAGKKGEEEKKEEKKGGKKKRKNMRDRR